MEDNKRKHSERYMQRKKKRQREIAVHIGICSLVVVLLLAVSIGAVRLKNRMSRVAAAPETESGPDAGEKYIAEQPEMDVQLLPVNEYSRPGYLLEEVNGIVVHYTGNPGTTAQQNHDYFAGLAETGETNASSHFIIGLSGEIIQCIPCNEIAYASNDRNYDTIAIECCIPDETGEFTGETYQSLIRLVTWLMGRYSLDVEDVIRHYDVTGKLCPKYFAENESAWLDFKSDLLRYIQKNGISRAIETAESACRMPVLSLAHFVRGTVLGSGKSSAIRRSRKASSLLARSRSS